MPSPIAKMIRNKALDLRRRVTEQSDSSRGGEPKRITASREAGRAVREAARGGPDLGQAANDLASNVAKGAAARSNVPDDVETRARRAGEMGAPIDATLDPMGDPQGIESFAAASIDAPDSQQRSSRADLGADVAMLSDEMVAGSMVADDQDSSGGQWFGGGDAFDGMGDADDEPEGWF